MLKIHLSPVRTKRLLCSGLPSAVLLAKPCFSLDLHRALKTLFRALLSWGSGNAASGTVSRRPSSKPSPRVAEVSEGLPIYSTPHVSSVAEPGTKLNLKFCFGATATGSPTALTFRITGAHSQQKGDVKQQNAISCHGSRFHFLYTALYTAANTYFQPCIG